MKGKEDSKTIRKQSKNLRFLCEVLGASFRRPKSFISA